MNANFGFEKLTIDNWLEPDKAWTGVVNGILPDGHIQLMTGNNWVQSVLDFDLLDITPPEVQKLFEVARGAMAYGYFFYPLLTLATEQLYRVAEAALDYKCRGMGRHKPKAGFHDMITWLTSESVIADRAQWDIIRELRNKACHPKNEGVKKSV
jgi:hypothetical protein